MTRTRKAFAASVLLAAAALALTACSGGIQNSDDLVNAYTSAGGTCDDRSEMVNEIGTWTTCDGQDLVLVAGQNALEEFDGGWVVGDNWIASVPDEIGTKMGGTPSMCKRGSGCTPVSGS